MRHIDHASLSFIIPKFYYHNAINAVDVLHQKTNVFVAMPDEVINKSYRYLTMVFCQIFRLLLIFSLMGSCVAWGNLSKQTENPIQGTAPYLSIKFKNGETRKVLNSDDLLYMAFYDGDKLKIYDSKNNLSKENPLTVPETAKTFEHILLPIPITASYDASNFQFINLAELSSKWGVDDDGDQNIKGEGKVKVRIYNDVSNSVRRDAQFVACDSKYYRITLILTSGSSVSTDYGSPKKITLVDEENGDASVDFFIQHKIKPSACWVTPNMSSSGGVNNSDNYNGPADQWDFDKGFLPQNINQPSLNFPTSGMDKLWFYLTMAETKVNDMTYTTEPSDSKLRLDITPVSDNKKVIAKITLHGPNSSTILPQDTFVPTTFTIFTDQSKKTKLYTFKIAQWFIVKPNSNDNKKGVIYSEAKNYCESIGYRLPLIGDLTNANAPDSAWEGGLPGQPNNYQRRIGGGLLAEWGDLKNTNEYSDSNVTLMKFWGVNYQGDNNLPYLIDNSTGQVMKGGKNLTAQAICVSP